MTIVLFPPQLSFVMCINQLNPDCEPVAELEEFPDQHSSNVEFICHCLWVNLSSCITTNGRAGDYFQIRQSGKAVGNGFGDSTTQVIQLWALIDILEWHDGQRINGTVAVGEYINSSQDYKDNQCDQAGVNSISFWPHGSGRGREACLVGYLLTFADRF